MKDAPRSALSRAEHRDVLLAAAGPGGSLRRIGDDHLALHRPGGARGAGTLGVTFEALDVTRARIGGLPFSTGFAQKRGCATLDIMAEGRTWFRDPALHAAFDGHTDDGFFDGFDRVLFAGGAMGAYGAAAFSVACPGATLLLMQLYASLARDVAPWERRFRSAWALDFESRYGNAARMIDAASRVYLVTDPWEAADATHASLFQGDHVVRLPAAHAGADIQGRLEAIGILDRLLAGAESGVLTPMRFAQLWRGRRRDADWLAGLMRKVDRADRPWLQAMVAGHVLRHVDDPASRRRLDAALARLAEDGRGAPASPVPDLPEAARSLLAGE